MIEQEFPANEVRVIAPSLGKRTTGIDASLHAVLAEQGKHTAIAGLGFRIPQRIPHVSFGQLCRCCRRGPWRIWHARRNIEMLSGLILRYIFGFKLLLVFTSAAQRRHTWITRFYYHRMDGLIATSQAGAGYLDRPAVVVQHGVNTETFSPPENRARVWADVGLPGLYGIGVIGRIRPQKGTEEFVDAMIRVLPQRPDWTAVIAGKITERWLGFALRLKAKIRKANLEHRIHFTGFVNIVDMPQWYQALSVVVCPSRVEGFGLPCLEGMSSGCPVVATETGAWPEIISPHIDGHVVPCRDSNALTEAILTITSNPDRVTAMGCKAREKILQHYCIKNEAEGIREVYDQVFQDAPSLPSKKNKP